MDISGADCALARESISADLDGELSELDLRRLRAHLRVCADCSEWAGDVTAVVTRLHDAELEIPAVAFELEPRRRTRRLGSALAAVPAAALVAAVAVFLGTAQHGSIGRQRPITTPASPTDIHLGPPAQHREFHAV